MKKLSMYVVVMSSVAFGLTELAISPDTALVGETFTVTGLFSEPGASATVFTFLDVNGNGVYDETTDLCEYGPDDGAEIVDGDWSTDTVEDGLISGALYTTEEPWRLVGRHVSILTDQTGSDTGAVVVLMDTTDLWISGTVRGPDGPLAFVPVCLQVEYESDGEMLEYAVDVLSDTNGKYLIYLPEELAGSDSEVELLAEDRFDKTPWDVLSPGPLGFGASDFTSPRTDVDIIFIDAPYTIVGQLVNEHEFPIGEQTLLLTGDNGMDIVVVTDDNGEFVTAAPEGILQIGLDEDQATDYLFQSTEVEVGGAEDTIEMICRVHSTDMAVSGKIVDTFNVEIDFDGVPIEVESTGDTQWNGVAYPEAYGTFSVPVSSAIGPYMVCIGDDEGLPENYSFSVYCIEGIEAGTDDLEVFIVDDSDQSSVRLPRVNPVSSLRIHNTPHGMLIHADAQSGDIERISIYDTHGRLVFSSVDGGRRSCVAGINHITPPLPGGRYVMKIDVKTPDGPSSLTGSVIVNR